MNIGIDIVKNSRVERLYEKFGEGFLNKFFTPLEIEYIASRGNGIETISGLFAAKEAVVKAIGTGFSGAVKFHSIEIQHETTGAPFAVYRDERISLSISNERDYSISVAMVESELERCVPNEISSLVKERDPNGHKGSFGKVMAISGSKGMLGAGRLSSMAALRSGCGLVYNYVPEDAYDMMSMTQLEVIVRPYSPQMDYRAVDSILFGPGIGLDNEVSKAQLKSILSSGRHTLIDADGITILSKDLALLESAESKVVLTPHLGEFKRLLHRDIDESESIVELAISFAKGYNCILLLKGHNTIVTDGSRVYINSTGNSGMATAGSGDVLSGIIAGLMAQAYEPFDATCLGAYIHGLSGDIASEALGEHSVIASDILEHIGKAGKIVFKY